VSDPSSASLRVVPSPEGASVVGLMRSSGAVAFRPTEWGVWMVGASAHPIGGDRLLMRVVVDAGCAAEIRATSATLARRAPFGGSARSVTSTVVRVGAAASLAWKPEPGVAACGSDHVSDTRIRLAAGATLSWRDEFVLGRYAEEPGTWTSRIRVSVAGRPLMASQLAAGPGASGWASPAVLGGAQAVSTLVVVDPYWPPGRPSARVESGGVSAVALPLPGPGLQITAWGDDLASCRAAVEELVVRQKRI
jgi:urease accessory protein